MKALHRMAHDPGRGLRLVVTGLSPEEIVVVGEFTRMWDRYGPAIEAEVAAAVRAGKPPRLRPAPDPRMSRLRGTVALVLYKHFPTTQLTIGLNRNGDHSSESAI